MMNKKENNEEMMNRIKKAAKKSLAAVLAGAIALGGLGVAGRLADYRTVKVQAAEDEGETLKLLRTENADEDDGRTRGYLDVADIVEEAMPSVVSISTKSIQEVQDYFSMFGLYGYAPRSEEYEVTGGGSGIIIGRNEDELLIVTNYHVVEGANELACCFVDNNAYKGKVKGYDEDKDVAVVAIPLDDIDDETLASISVAKIGSSDDLRVGEQILIIGNAMGYGQSVTTGIVSAKNRQIDDYGNQIKDEDGVNLIQTDAAINSGNSGGAMLNMDGEVVGISSSKIVGTTVEGLCYAIAISDVADTLETIMNQETREKVGENHGVLGIKATTVSEEAHQIYGIPEGAFIAEVDKDSAAEKAGLSEQTIITKFNGLSIDSVQDLIDLLEYYDAGEEVEITVAEPDGREYKEEVYTVKLQKSTAQEEDNDEDRDSRKKDDKSDDDDNGFFGDWQDSFDWGDSDDDDDYQFGDGTFGEWN
jgi:serine protease Do